MKYAVEIAHCGSINQAAQNLYVTQSSLSKAMKELENVLGYAFCVFQRHPNDNILTDIKTLYIDDLCVDETLRGQHIGSSLYRYVLDYAKKEGCYNLTLNVWECNQGAKRFYESCGLVPQKTGMEKIL